MIAYLDAGALLALHRSGEPQRIFKSCIAFLDWLARHPCQPIYTKGIISLYARLREAAPEELKAADISIRSNNVMASIRLFYKGKSFDFLSAESLNMPRGFSAVDALDYFNTLRLMLGYWPRSVGTASKRLYNLAWRYMPYPEPKLSDEHLALCRDAFYGGFNYLRPGIYDVNTGIVYDCNKMYASIFRSAPLPTGKPIEFKGEPPASANVFYVHRFKCSFKLRAGHLPFIILKDNFKQQGYATEGAATTLTLAKPDFELFKANYRIYNYEPLGGLSFLACSEMFRQYIDHLNSRIASAFSPGEKAAYKILGNALFGAYAIKDIKGRIIYKDGAFISEPDYSRKSSSYLPISVAIASYARALIIPLAERERSNFIYSDTDSLHLHRPSRWIQPTNELGGFKIEERFKRSRYFGRRKYVMELSDNSIKAVLAGLPYGSDRGMKYEDYQRGVLIPVTIKHLLPNGSIEFDHLKYEL